MQKEKNEKRDQVLNVIMVLVFCVALVFMAGVPAYKMVRGMSTLMSEDQIVQPAIEEVAKPSEAVQ